jgi:hypothetical protein
MIPQHINRMVQTKNGYSYPYLRKVAASAAPMMFPTDAQALHTPKINPRLQQMIEN